MEVADTTTVLGDFNDASYTYNGVTSRFFRRDGRFWVATDGPDGTLTEYPVSYTFGVYPLQQYLIAFPRGRYQALGIAWDTRARSEGGQRWYHLYPDEQVDHRDVLHWTGMLQNWNFMCAQCHSTNLQKGYVEAADSYATTWSEIDVSCEACHGPGSAHVALAERRKGATDWLDRRHRPDRLVPRYRRGHLGDGHRRRHRAPERAAVEPDGSGNLRTLPCAARAGVARFRARGSSSRRPSGWRSSTRGSTTPTASSTTRCTSTARSCRAGCTAPG